MLCIVRKPRIGGGPDIAGGEVREQRILAGAAIAVTGIALRLATKEVVTCLLLWRELRLARKHRIELRGEVRYLGGCLVAGDRLRHLIERGGGPAAIQRSKMDRYRLVGGWWSRPVTDLLHVGRPLDRKSLRTPNLFEQGAIGPLRGAVDGTGNIGQAHLHGIGRRSLRLLGRRVAQSAAGCAHVPEIAAHEIALAGVVVQNRRQRRVSVRLRLAVAESCAHRAGIGSDRAIEFRHRTGEPRLGHVAERTSLIAVYREVLVIQHQLAEQLDLLDLVIWRGGKPLERLCLDALDLGLNLRNFFQCLRCERCNLFGTDRAGAQDGGNGNRRQHHPSHRSIDPAPARHSLSINPQPPRLRDRPRTKTTFAARPRR